MLYNLLLLGGVRHRLQLIYLSWMTAMLAYGLGWTGLIHYVAPGMATADVSQFTYFVAATGMAMGVIFLVEFFSEGQLPFWLERAQRVLAIMLLGAALVATRSEEHTSELQSLMRISYAVCCLQKKNKLH